MSGDRWRLEDIYPVHADWESELSNLMQLPARISAFRGRLAEGPEVLVECLGTYYDGLRRLYRASSYASMRYHEDTRVGETAEMEQRARLVGTALSEAASFIDPEILEIGETTVRTWLDEFAPLKVYAHVLDDALRRAEHTLTPSEEEIVATAGLITDAPYSVYGMLANADMPWPTVRLSDGTEERLDQSTYARLRASSVREDREIVFQAFWSKWQEYSRTFGATLYGQIKRDLFRARVRKYPSSLAAALDADRIPERVYRTLIDEANAGLPVLHRYFRLRARMLELDQLAYFDIYPPLVRTDRKFGIDEAKTIVLDAVEPLGPEARTIVSSGFEGGWMDVYPRPGKRPGAYMNGHVYDVHPYVLMNYTDDYRSVSTLAHEWGHALHSSLANRSQDFVNSGYSIFTAEVASTFLEALLLDRMLRASETDEERIFFLGHALEGLRGTFFRQTMFAEFELAIHEVVEEGEALSGDRLTAMYGELVRRYHGHDESVVLVDDAYTVEWAYIPHFYYNFYVYQYATSEAASALLAERLLAGETGAGDRFLGLLRAGGSDYPYELMVRAGVDLAKPEPYRALLRRMEAIMDEIEALLDD
ncbi:MAG: oligoendopeptidase F [Gemmatimonadota bacterium]